MQKIYLTLLILCLTASYGFCSTINSYDKHGNRTGSYITTSNGTTIQYDKSGNRVGTYKTTSNGTIT